MDQPKQQSCFHAKIPLRLRITGGQPTCAVAARSGGVAGAIMAATQVLMVGTWKLVYGLRLNEVDATQTEAPDLWKLARFRQRTTT